ncbi:uncharacterized protein LOC143034942 [Oratosquilla oratoria]|uniref:uncharacterized protein LOC143034942 n=1 Tax=Oratosquilla oratoria TaxID=337810 RepID=UPI003F77698C
MYQRHRSLQATTHATLPARSIIYSDDALVGKLQTRGSVSTPSPANQTHTLLSVRDSHTGLSFLVDTSSAVSIIPPTRYPSQGTSLPSCDLLAANGTPIATYGSHYSVLDLQNGKFPWTFVIAYVRQPILGYDFLQYYKMTVSAKDNCLYHATRRIPGTTTNASSPKVSSLQPAGEYTRILQNFPQLTSSCKATTTRPHNIVHHIQTIGPSVCSKPRRLSPEKLVAAKQEFQDLLDQGIIRPSESA